MTRLFTAILITSAALALTACETPPPVVSDFNGDSVKIQTMIYNDAQKPEVLAQAQVEADRICATRGRRAEYASTVPIPNYRVEHLYLCLEPTRAG